MFLQWDLNDIFCIYYRLLSLLNAMLSLEIAGQFPQPLSQRLHAQYDAVKDLENRMDKRHKPDGQASYSPTETRNGREWK